ncbi:hypothetical protein [Paracoccus luteus]|uniref:hypothetical protein n=1 Tax=Paracoccus luteus TaxID=2508543 RepID=UPI00106F8BC8|nr:hypothetical protein [Paracoccus luteus]
MGEQLVGECATAINNGPSDLKRILVIGVAKTGTTVISKTIQNTLQLGGYNLEPKTAAFFEELAKNSHETVVKILYDHWMDRPRLLNSIIHNEFRTGFDVNLFIVRDPRAEFISRLHYIAFPYFSGVVRPEKDVTDWTDLFERLETDPAFGLVSMLAAMRDRFGTDLTGDIRRAASVRLATYIRQLPPHLYHLIKYEDFMSGRTDDHPLAHMFSGSRNVGGELSRTKRSDDPNDWKAYVKTSEDKAWLQRQLSSACEVAGYEDSFDDGGMINPDNCSVYVKRLIREARQGRR